MIPLLARTYWVAVNQNGEALRMINRTGHIVNRPALYEGVCRLQQALKKRTDVDDPSEWRAVAIRLEAAE